MNHPADEQKQKHRGFPHLFEIRLQAIGTEGWYCGHHPCLLCTSVMLGESQDDSERESIQQSTTSTTSSWLSHPIGKYWSVKLDDFLSSTGKQVNMLKSHWIHYLDLAFQLQVSVILRLMGLSFRLGVQHPTVTSAHQAYMISYSTGCTKDYCQTHHTLRVKVHTTT